MNTHPELIRFEETIINLANVTSVEYEANKVSVAATVPGATSFASADSSLTLRFIGGDERQFKGIAAARLWAKLVSLSETLTVSPGADQES
jgi:hypothetical protein